MGSYRHDAIIVTSWRASDIEKAHAHARDVFADTCVHVGNITDVGANGFRSFLIPPDGSKEGCPASDAAHKAFAAFMVWLNEQASADWVAVNFGGDDYDILEVSDPLGSIRRWEGSDGRMMVTVSPFWTPR